MELSEGDIVGVPLGPRMVVGVVSDLRDASGVNRPLRSVATRSRRAAAAVRDTRICPLGGPLCRRHSGCGLGDRSERSRRPASETGTPAGGDDIAPGPRNPGAATGAAGSPGSHPTRRPRSRGGRIGQRSQRSSRSRRLGDCGDGPLGRFSAAGRLPARRRLESQPKGGGDGAPGDGARAPLWHGAARRRHRIGQDRGLSGGRRRRRCRPIPGPRCWSCCRRSR